MNETKPTGRGGSGRGQGRKPGSLNKSPERALIALCQSIEKAIRSKDFQTAREHAQKLSYILSFIPSSQE